MLQLQLLMKKKEKWYLTEREMPLYLCDIYTDMYLYVIMRSIPCRVSIVAVWFDI